MPQMRDDFTPDDFSVDTDDFVPDDFSVDTPASSRQPRSWWREALDWAPFRGKAKEYGTRITDPNNSITGTYLESLGRGFLAGANEGLAEFITPLNVLTAGKGKIAQLASGAMALEGTADLEDGDYLEGASQILFGGLGLRSPKVKPASKPRVTNDRLLYGKVQKPDIDLYPYGPDEQRLLGGDVEIYNSTPAPAPEIKQLGARPNRLALPAQGETSIGSNSDFFAGPSGIGSADMNYPHILGREILPDIGPELAASRSVLNPAVPPIQLNPATAALIPEQFRVPETIPFREPRGLLKPTPRDNVLETRLEHPAGGVIVDPPLLDINNPRFAADTLLPNESGLFRQKPSLTNVPADELPLVPGNKGSLLDASGNPQQRVKSSQFPGEEQLPRVPGFDSLKDAVVKEPIVMATLGDKKPLNAAIKANPKVNWFSELWNFNKTAKTAGDFSAAFRQGTGAILYPEYWKNFKNLFTNYGSEAAHQATMGAIRNNKYYDLGQKVKLQTTSLDDIVNREEAIMSSIASKGVPWFGKGAQKVYQKTAGRAVHASNRSYTGFLAKTRQDLFSSMVDDAKRMGIDPEKDTHYASLIAEFVNTATGRSSLGKLEKNAVGLNNAFFSPRFLASRIEGIRKAGDAALGTIGVPLPRAWKDVFEPKNYERMPKQLRHAYMRAAVGQAGFWFTLAGIGKLSGIADVSLDPNSADFGKLKLGNVRLDPGQGFQQILVMLSRLGSGQFTSTNPDTGSYELGSRYGGEHMGSVMGRFGVNKSHPNLSPILNKVFFKKDIDMGQYAPTPMMLEDAYEIMMKEDPALLATLVPGAFGIPTQRYSFDEE
jgi:hypothetical protein